ncbi:extracellular matrix regulator RemB [Clostridium formicaceticum]|uniref:DUF370 domain-containing protein n=1 Tax=Clostridium formicaceticum TaxID=1497 RepID=A0AAC9RHZ0_9CLOT|nr:extracellular matrix/biofilm biosynthesis regulator RemA family protein [Clostridium formicaceticum]AOY75420.1 DUF370 domain-containing protein [Clostridium formicaceticum]ARE85698.1 hypothetical protein CLFO_00050 [Clostridium formicaceticum]
MFLHLGGEFVVKIKDIIAILDIESALKSKDSKAFLKVCEEEEFIQNICEEEPRSIVIVERVENKNRCHKGAHKTVIYKSPISALTLQKRAGFIHTLPLS